jgi:hypothetical protein
MSDIAVTVIKSGEDYSCGVYYHWHGSTAIEILAEAIPCMRKADPMYSCARLIGVAHNKILGNTGLGVLPPPSKKDIENNFFNYSHGDSGVIIYDCDIGEVQLYAGYLKDERPFIQDIGIPPP